jgi:hypothetical protein
MSNVTISDKAHKALKLYSAKKEKTMREVVETLILKYTAKGWDK